MYYIYYAARSGLGICSFALSLKIALLTVKSHHKRFALVALLKKATVRESLLSLFKKEQQQQFVQGHSLTKSDMSDLRVF